MTDDERLEFASMVRKAKGSQSLSEFSKKTGISKYQLSRIMNGKFKELPRRSTLQAIAVNCEDVAVKMELGISLLGYKYETVNGIETRVEDDPREKLLSFLNVEVKMKRKEQIRSQVGRILAELSETSHTWMRKKVEDKLKLSLADHYLYIELLDDVKMKKWHFYFVPKSQKTDEFFYTFLGRLSCCQIDNDEKFILVPENERMYMQLLGKKPNGNANLSVIYFDNDGFTESTEDYLQVADGMTKEDIRSSAFLESTMVHKEGSEEIYFYKNMNEDICEVEFT